MTKIVEETGKAVAGFYHVMREQPLALALVISNFGMLAYIFYSGSNYITTRRQTTELIVAWQQRTDQLMASCVSSDIMQMVLTALKRNGVNIRPEPEASPKQP